MLEMYILTTMVLFFLITSIAELFLFKDKLTKRDTLYYTFHTIYISILLVGFLITMPEEAFSSEKVSELSTFPFIYGVCFLVLIFLNILLSLLTPLSFIIPNAIIDLFVKNKRGKALTVRTGKVKYSFVYILLVNIVVLAFFIYLIQIIKIELAVK